MNLFLILLSTFFVSSSAFNFQGATKPLGFFDPFSFSERADTSELIRLREAELKHGRWAMISAVSIPLLETSSHQPAIHAFDHLEDVQKIAILASIMTAELTIILKGWENPYTLPNKYFKMKEDYQPGDLGFKINAELDDDLVNKELNNGRLAMIASIGMIAQELVTDSTLF